MAADKLIARQGQVIDGVAVKRAVVRNLLPEFISTVQARAAKAITQSLILGGAEASAMTPIDTGTLINSQFRNVTKNGQEIIGTIGFTAEYAAAVHSPDHPQNFRRASAEKEFLRKGFERAEPAIKEALRRALKA